MSCRPVPSLAKRSRPMPGRCWCKRWAWRNCTTRSLRWPRHAALVKPAAETSRGFWLWCSPYFRPRLKNRRHHQKAKVKHGVNQRGKLTRDPRKTALNFFHPGDVQPSGAFAGATWGVTHGIHSRNQMSSFCGRRERQRDCPIRCCYLDTFGCWLTRIGFCSWSVSSQPSRRPGTFFGSPE